MAERLEKPMSREGFEALLLEVRDGAQAVLSEFADQSVRDTAQHDAKIGDARAVWHVAEFALAMLMPGRYLPKREALDEATELVDRLAETKDTGGQG
jgi:hypothetical protein